MLTENRKYNFIGELTLDRSRVLDEGSEPKDDKVNWLFLNTREQLFSFVYKIKNPSEAKYGKPIIAELAFTAIEAAISIVKLNHSYEVLRGQETIGFLKLIDSL